MSLAVYRDDVVKAYSTEMARQPRKTICWVFQWGGKVRIEGPEDAVTEYKEMARKALEG